MTPEQQRIAIAKACGWIILHYNYEQQNYKYEPGILINGPVGVPPNKTSHCGVQPAGGYSNAGTPWYVPDYLNDLNAMHEAEISCIIPNGLWDDYVGHLKAIMYQGERFWGQATAAQRAEAFLRTIGLWSE